MTQHKSFQKTLSGAISLLISVCLAVGLAPAAAFGDTTVGVKVDAPVQVNETVVIDPADESQGVAGTRIDGSVSEDASDELADTLGKQSQLSSEVAVGSDSPAPKPSQITTDVALGTSSSNQTETLLVDGLTYLVDHKTESATLTGWYGNAPAGGLSIPSQVTDGKVVYSVENGGRF